MTTTPTPLAYRYQVSYLPEAIIPVEFKAGS